MKAVYVFLVLTSALPALSQDSDYPDYRSKKESFAKIAEKDIKTDLASFTMGGIDLSISKLPLQKIPVSDFGKNHMSFEGNNIQVRVTIAPFNPSAHKLRMIEEHVVKIDNKPFYGNYGEMPRTSIESLLVVIDKDTVAIPGEAFADLHNIRFSYFDAQGVERTNNGVYLSPDKKTVYIYLLNRDGAGGYEVTWVIRDKQYLRRVIDFDILK